MVYNRLWQSQKILGEASLLVFLVGGGEEKIRSWETKTYKPWLGHFAIYLLIVLKAIGQLNSEEDNNGQRWRVQNLREKRRRGRRRRWGGERNTKHCSAGRWVFGWGVGKMLQFSWNNNVERKKGIQRVGFSLSVKYKHRWILSLVCSCFSLCTAGMFLRSCPLRNFTKWKPWTLHDVIIITPAILSTFFLLRIQ